VLSSEPEIATSLAHWASGHGLTIVEHPDARAPVWDRRRPSVIPTDEALRDVAQRSGATRILTATAEKNAHPLTYRYAGYSEGPPWLTTVYDPIITIRSLDVSRPVTFWTVIAGTRAPRFFWGEFGELVDAALRHVEVTAEANGHRRASCAIH
jgi:hypothetical protein